MMAGEFIASLAVARRRAEADRDEHFEPPYTTMQASVMSGGTAVNVLAREARVMWEYRALPDRDAKAIFDRAKARAADILPRYRDGRAGSRLHDACPRRLSRPRARRRIHRRCGSLARFPAATTCTRCPTAPKRACSRRREFPRSSAGRARSIRRTGPTNSCALDQLEACAAFLRRRGAARRAVSYCANSPTETRRRSRRIRSACG